jgi:tetratricopeptide (TPR) repeat protein
MSGLDPEIQLPITLTLDDHVGPAARVTQDRLQSMVAAALVEYDQVHAASRPTANSGEASPKHALKLKNTHWLVAAGAVLAIVGSVAAARYFFFAPEPKQLPAIQAHAAAPQPSAAALSPPPTAADPSEAAKQVSWGAANDTELDDSDAVGTLPGAGPDNLRSRRTVTGRSSSTNAPEDLLQKANQLRAAGRFGNAEQTYSLVYDRFPKTPAAYVARVAAASLELEHLSNPLKARKLFEQALQDRPKGALDLEARQGLSVALRDLEDRAGERDTLRALIARHPGSPAARRAQVRLMELGGE